MENVSVTQVPDNVQLIDVREPDEYAEVHARGAVNVPLSELTTRHGEIDDSRPVYVICRSGGRSLQASQYLEGELGMEEIINVEGGTSAWVEADLPTE